MVKTPADAFELPFRAFNDLPRLCRQITQAQPVGVEYDRNGQAVFGADGDADMAEGCSIIWSSLY